MLAKILKLVKNTNKKKKSRNFLAIDLLHRDIILTSYIVTFTSIDLSAFFCQGYVIAKTYKKYILKYHV